MMESTIRRDFNFWFLLLNMLLVLLGYAFVYAMGLSYAAPAKSARLLFLFISIAYLIRSYPVSILRVPYLRQPLILLLVSLFMISVLFSEHITYSIGRTLTFVIPFLYIFFCIKYLILKYGFNSAFYGFNFAVNLVYMLPLVTFLYTGASFQLTNIYGDTKESGLMFVSNHFGWSSAIFLLSGFDLLTSKRLNRFNVYVIYIMALLSVYLLLISGSRSSLLSVGLALMVFRDVQ